MDAATTAKVFAALGHEGRLLLFRMLAHAGPEGLPAGEIARRAGHLQNTTSSHLSVLANVGLVAGRRQGRSIIYAVQRARFAEAVGSLTAGLIDDPLGEKTALLLRRLEAWGGEPADDPGPQGDGDEGRRAVQG